MDPDPDGAWLGSGSCGDYPEAFEFTALQVEYASEARRGTTEPRRHEPDGELLHWPGKLQLVKLVHRSGSRQLEALGPEVQNATLALCRHGGSLLCLRLLCCTAPAWPAARAVPRALTWGY